MCNPVYTSYHIRPTKERLSVLGVLRNGRQRIFRLNEEALGYLENQLKWSKAVWGTLQSWVAEQDLGESAFLERLDAELPGLGKQHRKLLIDAAAVAAYHAEKGSPVVRALICDDAPPRRQLEMDMAKIRWFSEALLGILRSIVSLSPRSYLR